MSIQGDVAELEGLKQEITNLSRRLKKLRKHKQAVELKIMNYLHSKNTHGVKHRGTALVMEEKMTRSSKSNKQRRQDAISVLESYGVNYPEEVLEKLMEARKGEQVSTNKLKMKKYKDNRY